MPQLNPTAEAAFWAGLEATTRFFMGVSDVRKAMEKLMRLLEEHEISYAVVGAMALNELGYRRMTSDVDVLLTSAGLAKFKAACLGLGYPAKSPGSRGFRDTENNVEIDVVLTGNYPGDGKVKPVAFPDPAIAEQGNGVRLLPVPRFLELKLASGMTAPHRLKDLADVLEVIRAAQLPRTLGDELHPNVRAKFLELWDAASRASTDEE